MPLHTRAEDTKQVSRDEHPGLPRVKDSRVVLGLCFEPLGGGDIGSQQEPWEQGHSAAVSVVHCVRAPV